MFTTRKKFTSPTTLIAMTALLVGVTAGGSQAEVPPLEEPMTVHLTVDGVPDTVETTQETVGAVLAEQAIKPVAADRVSPSLDAPVADESAITLVKSKRVNLKVGKSPRRVRTLAVLTVADALKASRVTLTRHDTVKPALTTLLTPGAAVTVTKVKYKNSAKRVKIKHKTKVKKSNKLYKGEKRTRKAGRHGIKRVVYKHKFINSKKVSTKRVRTVIKRKAKTRVVVVGTKARPAISGVWRALAQCESGGNPSIVSSNGLYHGLFQFSVGTWHSVGGSGLPSRASSAEQLKRAKMLQARSGWGQWPHCSSKLGLR